MATNPNPKRGEIWMVDFSPQKGDEIQKVRPAVVINIPVFQVFALRVVIPITGWRSDFASRWTKVMIRPSPRNGLSKDSAADLHQLRSVSLLRFTRKVGDLEAPTLELAAAGIAAYVGAK